MSAGLARGDQVDRAGSLKLIVFGLDTDLVLTLVAGFSGGAWAHGFALG